MDTLKAENEKLAKQVELLQEFKQQAEKSFASTTKTLEYRAKQNKQLSIQLACLKAEKEQLKEDIQTYKETLDEHFHHYDLLKEKKNKEIDELKANFQVVWEVLGESSYADELNKRLFPENFEEEED